MARSIDAKCRKCRRAGEKLFLKGDRCNSPKCGIVRKPYIPGVHGKAGLKPGGKGGARGMSEFGKQLAMKQKIKRIYGVLEQQFRKHFDDVKNKPGVVGDLLLQRLEMRLDNVVFRMGFAPSRSMARQLVSHNFFKVNGKKLNIPSANIQAGDVITLNETKKASEYAKKQAESLKTKKDVPQWVALDVQKMEGKVLHVPARDQIGENVDPQVVVEYYSK